MFYTTEYHILFCILYSSCILILPGCIQYSGPLIDFLSCVLRQHKIMAWVQHKVEVDSGKWNWGVLISPSKTLLFENHKKKFFVPLPTPIIPYNLWQPPQLVTKRIWMINGYNCLPPHPPQKLVFLHLYIVLSYSHCIGYCYSYAED